MNTGMKYPAGRGRVQARTNIHISDTTHKDTEHPEESHQAVFALLSFMHK